MAVILEDTADNFKGLVGQLENINSTFELRFKQLSPEQKKVKNTVGIKRRGFIELSRIIAEKNTDYIPNYFNAAEFGQLVDRIQDLTQAANALKKLQVYIKNAEIFLGNEAYAKALSVHRHLRESARSGVSGARPLYDRLKKLFANGGRKPLNPAETQVPEKEPHEPISR